MIEWLRFETIWLLSKFRFYRKLNGGTWYLVKPKYDLFYDTYWINTNPAFNEIVIDTENW